ncbi:thermonuclease family protein [Enhygromyxa salina]|uniref:thermonuclease family protein n=1 Tax=Enhygromyxa salina TaxID=215803 RepID=UPI001FD1DE4E|nr:thermonuclease family protein [Enhygromyxa salina]
MGWLLAGLVTLALGCDTEPAAEIGEQLCGPSEAKVARVVDGDTIELETGERVRYLMIDTPESTTETECWGAEAKAANVALVEGKTVTLTYDVECEDAYGRLLAYVELSGQEINRVMIERGHACVLHISPNGDAIADEYEALEYQAQMQLPPAGLWATCDPIPCG